MVDGLNELTDLRLYDPSKGKLSPSCTASAQEDQSMSRCELPPQGIFLIGNLWIGTSSATAGVAPYNL